MVCQKIVIFTIENEHSSGWNVVFNRNDKQEITEFSYQANLKAVWLAEYRIMAGRAKRDIRERSHSMHNAIMTLTLCKLQKLQK